MCCATRVAALIPLDVFRGGCAWRRLASRGTRPKVDVVLEMLLARPDNAPLLRSMIEAVVDLPAPIEQLVVLDPEIPRELAVHKTVVVDLDVRCADGSLLDVETSWQGTPRACMLWLRRTGR